MKLAVGWIFVVHLTYYSSVASSSKEPVTTTTMKPAPSDQGEDALTRPVDKGMEPVYTMTNFFLETMINPKSLAELYEKVDLTDWNAIFHSLNTEWDMWIRHHYEYFICVLVGVVFSLATVAFGIALCICRCHGKCGVKQDEMDDKNTACKRRACVIGIIILLVPVMLGIVASFIGNQLAYEGTVDTGMSYAFHNSLGRLSSFQSDLLKSYDQIIEGHFEESSSEIIADIGDYPHRCKEVVDEKYGVTALFDEVESYVARLNNTKFVMMEIDKLSADLLDAAFELSNLVDDMRENMTFDFEYCQDVDENCAKALKMIEDLQVVLNASELIGSMAPSVQLIEDVTTGDRNIFDGLNEALAEFHTLSDLINTSTSVHLRALTTSTESFGGDVQVFINYTVTRMTSISFTQAQDFVSKTMGPWMKKAGDIKYFICLGGSLFIVIVMVIYFIALGFGLCGERANVDAHCCNRGNSASLLMASAYLTMVGIALLFLAISLLLVPGGIAHTDVCQHLVKMEDDEVLRVFDDIINAQLKINISATSTYLNCQQDETFYTALECDTFGEDFNVSHIIQQGMTDIHRELDSLHNVSLTSNIVLLNEILESNLVKLSTELSDIDFSLHWNQINSVVTALNLTSFSHFLAESAKNTTEELAEMFMSYSQLIQQLQDENAALIEGLQDLMARNVHSVEDFLNETDPMQLRNQINNTQQMMNHVGIQEAVMTVSNELSNEYEDMNQLLEDEVRYSVGNCLPVYTAVADSITEACVIFLYPFNAYWFSMGWCLFFMTFTVPLAILLAGYYEKTEKYSKMPEYTFQVSSLYSSVPSVHRQRTRHKGPGPPATMDVTESEFEMLDLDSYEKSFSDLYGHANSGFTAAKENDDGGFGEFRTNSNHCRQLSSPNLTTPPFLGNTFNPDFSHDSNTPSDWSEDRFASRNLAYRANSHVYDSPIISSPPPEEGPDPYTPYENLSDNRHFQYDNPGYSMQLPEPQHITVEREKGFINSAYF